MILIQGGNSNNREWYVCLRLRQNITHNVIFRDVFFSGRVSKEDMLLIALLVTEKKREKRECEEQQLRIAFCMQELQPAHLSTCPIHEHRNSGLRLAVQLTAHGCW